MMNLISLTKTTLLCLACKLVYLKFQYSVVSRPDASRYRAYERRDRDNSGEIEFDWFDAFTGRTTGIRRERCRMDTGYRNCFREQIKAYGRVTSAITNAVTNVRIAASLKQSSKFLMIAGQVIVWNGNWKYYT